jgi:predicted nucleotidyltransferase
MHKEIHNAEQKITDIKRILIQNVNPQRICLFGSRAKGTETKHSDFDIAIEGSTASFREMRKAEEQLDRILGIYSCDIVELEKTSDVFRALVKQQGKLIYERD